MQWGASRRAGAGVHGALVGAAAAAKRQAVAGRAGWLVVAQGTPDSQAQDQDAVAPTEDTYRYIAKGRRDPFESLVKERPKVTPLQRHNARSNRPRGPLERYDFPALKLVGILWGDLGRRGLIHAPDKKGYFVTVGMYVGQNGGQVVAIEPDRVVIEEKYKDAEGNIVGKTLTLPLRRKKKGR